MYSLDEFQIASSDTVTMGESSISEWIIGLRDADAEAAQELWNRYADRLVDLARRRLGNAPKRAADEEDIALSVFHSLCRGAESGRFDDIKNRDDLWWLLLAITKQKTVDYMRRETAQKRGGGQVQAESGFSHDDDGSKGFTLDHLVGQEPTPEFLVSLEEQNERLLGRLRDDKLRKIAVSRIEGYTVAEIATDLSISTRSVERKLQLIRSAWAEELSGVDTASE